MQTSLIKNVYVLLYFRSPRGLIPKGHWKDTTVDGKPRTIISCPTCGMVSNLIGYDVADDGTVSPSWECKFCRKFFSRIQLQGEYEGRS